MVTTEIELKRSLALLVLQLMMAMLAALAVGLAELPGAFQLVLANILLGTLAWGISQWRQPLPGLRLLANGRIQIEDGQGAWCNAEVLPGCFVSPNLSVVRLRSRDTTRRVVLLPDSGPADDMRRLRLSLRWAPRTHSDTAYPDAG